MHPTVNRKKLASRSAVARLQYSEAALPLSGQSAVDRAVSLDSHSRDSRCACRVLRGSDATSGVVRESEDRRESAGAVDSITNSAISAS